MARQATKKKPKREVEEVEWTPPQQPMVPDLPRAEVMPMTEAQVLAEPSKFARKDSEKRRQIVLEVLSQGYSVQMAANRAGVSRRLIFMWREKDKEFDAACKEAMEAGIDLMEDEALRRASQGVLKPIYQGGLLVGHVVEYSDRLLEMNLKARRPHKYRERVDMNTTGKFTIIQTKEDDECL